MGMEPPLFFVIFFVLFFAVFLTVLGLIIFGIVKAARQAARNQAQQARHAKQPGAHRQPSQCHLQTFRKTTSHTPWPSLMPRFSNLVRGR